MRGGSGRIIAAKVPRVGLAFWTIKLLTTAQGEATSDFLVHRFSPPLAVVATGLVFAAAIALQLTRPTYQTVPYWFAVEMVSVFGTMCADVAHVALHIPYVVSTIVFALVLAGDFTLWFRREGTLSIHSIDTTRREVFYWVAITSTFALGTATGDMTASTLHWGYLASGVVFAVAFALPGLAFRAKALGPVVSFWTSYVLTRPLGASFADYVGVSHTRGGLAWGPGNVSLLTSTLIVVAVALLARAERTLKVPPLG